MKSSRSNIQFVIGQMVMPLDTQYKARNVLDRVKWLALKLYIYKGNVYTQVCVWLKFPFYIYIGAMMVHDELKITYVRACECVCWRERSWSFWLRSNAYTSVYITNTVQKENGISVLAFNGKSSGTVSDIRKKRVCANVSRLRPRARKCEKPILC